MNVKKHGNPGIYATVNERIAKWGTLLFVCQVINGIWRMTWNRALARRLGTRNLKIFQGAYIQGIEYITIGDNFFAGQGFWLEAISQSNEQRLSPKIVIGKDVKMSFWNHIAAIESIQIGDNVMMGSKILITDHNHGSYGPDIHDAPDSIPINRALVGGPVVIGDNVWIGDGVVVTPNSTIGSGCVIGANSVVRGVIPPNTIAVGCPARPVKIFDSNLKQWIPVKSEK
jgi:lipopolysaccharide O-acetyltransferase